MLKLGCILPEQADICLHKTTDGKFCRFTEGDKNLFWKKFEKVLLVVQLGFSHSNQLLRLLFKSLQTYANLLLRLMPANYIPPRCVNSCLPVVIRDGVPIQKRLDSHLDKTRPAALKIWSSPISNEQDQNVILKASLQQADRKKLTVLKLIGFVLIATLCLKPCVAFTTSVPVKEVRLSLTEEVFQRGSKEREVNALRRHYIREKGFNVIETRECERWRI